MIAVLAVAMHVAPVDLGWRLDDDRMLATLITVLEQTGPADG